MGVAVLLGLGSGLLLAGPLMNLFTIQASRPGRTAGVRPGQSLRCLGGGHRR